MIPLRDHNVARTTPWVTWSVILLCGAVFAFQVAQVDEVQRWVMFRYALIPARLTEALAPGGDPLALLTVVSSMFMHGGVPHVVANLWFLRLFGDNVEDHFGHARYAVFYLLCGAAAAVTQWAIDPYSTVPMVGASGAIAGVLGAYAVLYPRARVVTLLPLVIIYPIVELRAFVLIAVWFGLQFFSGVVSLGIHSGGGVAYWAHIGGFLAGLGLTFVMRRRTHVAAEPVVALRVDDENDGYRRW